MSDDRTVAPCVITDATLISFVPFVFHKYCLLVLVSVLL